MVIELIVPQCLINILTTFRKLPLDVEHQRVTARVAHPALSLSCALEPLVLRANTEYYGVLLPELGRIVILVHRWSGLELEFSLLELLSHRHCRLL